MMSGLSGGDIIWTIS